MTNRSAGEIWSAMTCHRFVLTWYSDRVVLDLRLDVSSERYGGDGRRLRMSGEDNLDKGKAAASCRMPSQSFVVSVFLRN